MKNLKDQKRGIVTEALPGTKFRVEVEGKTIIAYLGGKLLKNNIRIAVKDKVEVVVPEGSERGRITWRY